MSRLPEIIKGDNDILFDREGHRLIDLFSANGTTWLGHCNPSVVAAVGDQLQRVWITGGLGTAICEETKALIEAFFPPTHSVAGLYSTGMEAAEFAIRVARSATGRNGIVGFENSMHGKSMATAHLGWDNHDGLDLPCVHRLPFIPDSTEEYVLRRLEEALKGRSVSAVFVEAMQGTGGGHLASPQFCDATVRLCREYGALAVFDEVLTGFYRTGTAFLASRGAVFPDVVVIGKAMGNGFPVSGVVVRRDIPITPRMLPGSTFAGNPLAAAATAATLKEMKRLDLPAMVAGIERTVGEAFLELPNHGIAVRGKGAMWVLELPEPVDVLAAVAGIYNRGALVNFTGHFIRILPAVTIGLDNLATGCRIVRDELSRAAHG